MTEPRSAPSSRSHPRRPSDGRIDSTAPAVAIQRLVRASARPFDGAHTTLEGEWRLTIWRESIVEIGHFLAVPGQVYLAVDGAHGIATG